MNFYFAKYKIIVELLEDTDIPAFKGALLRGGFGASFKDLVCVNKQEECDQCFLRGTCSYSYIFESRKEQGQSLFKSITKIPRPFVIETPLEDRREYKKGEELELGFIVIGKALSYVPYIVAALLRLMNRGIGRERTKAVLKKVIFLDEINSHEEVIFRSEHKDALQHYDRSIRLEEIQQKDPKQCNKIKIHFETMTRLVKDSKLNDTLDFDLFKRVLLRRISMLACYYFDGNEGVYEDVKALIQDNAQVDTMESNIQWNEWSRYSTRQKTRMKFGGIVGSVIFEGELEKYLPYILLGQYTHIGKNCTFGLGKYRVEFLES